MVNTSLTDISLMVMVNVLFISNFLFVRKLRTIVDGNESILDSLKRIVGDSPIAQAVQGFFVKYNTAASRVDDEVKKKGRGLEIVYAACLGRHRMTPSTAKTFPNWQPIPFKLGIISSAFALLISTILLSDNALMGKLAISTQGEQTSGYCATEDFDEKIKAFEDHIRGENVTNYYMAEQQFQTTSKFNETLNTTTTMDWLDKCDAEFKEKDAARIKDLCTIKQKVCIDSWGFSWLCKTIKITLPGCVDALHIASINAEEPEVDPLESDADISALEQLNQQSAILVQQLLRQIDIAGSLYSLYVCIALFFPTPIVLFRPSYTVRTKQVFCGASRYIFMATVLIIYWTYEYFYKLLQLPQVQIFFKNIVTDPCFLDGDFIKNRTAIVKKTCTELIKMENNWGIIDVKVDAALDVISDCSISFPFTNSSGYCPDLSNVDIVNREELALTKHFWSDTVSRGCRDAWAASEFIGNETICIDDNYSRDEILVADDTGLNWWELWMTSGLLASVLVKFSVANFGVALLKVADPFCVCDGAYESPPATINQDLIEEGNEGETLLHVDESIKETKIAVLKGVALRDCIF